MPINSSVIGGTHASSIFVPPNINSPAQNLTERLDSLLPTANNFMGGYKNKIINGNFDVWQRGTSFTIASGATAMVADRWWIQNSTNQTVTITPSTIPYNGKTIPRLRGSFSVAPTSGSVLLFQRIEDVNTLAGNSATLSFVLGGLDSLTIPITLSQLFGAGGSATVSTAFPNITYVGTSTCTKVSTMKVLPNVSSSTIGSSSYLQCEIYLPIRSTNAFSISQVQLEEGSVATLFESRHIAQELALCQRYFEVGGAFFTGFAETDTIICVSMPFVEKRTFPSVYKISGKTAVCRAMAGGDVSSSTSNIQNTTVQKNAMWVQVLGFSGLVVNTPVSGRCLVDANFLGIDSEL